LGITQDTVAQTWRRRSNVVAVVYDDMTSSALASASFDIVIAVEVLEHVTEDEAFVRNVARVLRPSGVFLLTTPNGDDYPVPNNPDHKRHYKRHQLETLLSKYFKEVNVWPAIRNCRFRRWGLAPWSPWRPFQTVRSMVGNFLYRIESLSACDSHATKTRHLIAWSQSIAPLERDRCSQS
jgi:SAM-dependent methyltransferase